MLKIANAAERREMLDTGNAVMRRLAATGRAPAVVPARDDADIARYGADFVRLVSALSRGSRSATRCAGARGRAAGEMDRARDGFDCPALHRSFHRDLAAAHAAVLPRVDG